MKIFDTTKSVFLFVLTFIIVFGALQFFIALALHLSPEFMTWWRSVPGYMSIVELLLILGATLLFRGYRDVGK